MIWSYLTCNLSQNKLLQYLKVSDRMRLPRILEKQLFENKRFYILVIDISNDVKRKMQL